jgi:hypothetical protein
MYQLKGYVLSQRALGDSGVGVMGHWGDGAMGPMRQRSHAPIPIGGILCQLYDA